MKKPSTAQSILYYAYFPGNQKSIADLNRDLHSKPWLRTRTTFSELRLGRDKAPPLLARPDGSPDPVT
jgi:hypothetical protein